MTMGEKMKNADTAFRALRPAALDDLAEEAHGRRRDADLARAMSAAADPRPGFRLRRPALLAAGAAAAACAVAGAIVLPGGAGQAPPPATEQGPVDARAVLLASAATAERAPAKPGRYWYVRIQTRTRHEHKSDLPGGRQRRPGAHRAEERPERLPYTFVTTVEEESWTARSPHDRTRTITGIGMRASFPTPQDEAEWRRAGSPALLSKEDRTRSVNDYDMPMNYMFGNADMFMDELRRLPVDATALGRELRRRYTADVRKAGGPENVDPYPYYVWATAQDLLAGPITPGTKAALYRVLAGQEGVRSDGAVTDPLGRRGVAVSMGGPGGRIRLIIDPKTAELLAYQSFLEDDGTAGLSLTYKAMGWVGSLGARP